MSTLQVVRDILTKPPEEDRYALLKTEIIKRLALSSEKKITKHYITTTPGPPVAARQRRLAPERLRAAKEEFNNLVKLGTVHIVRGSVLLLVIINCNRNR